MTMQHYLFKIVFLIILWVGIKWAEKKYILANGSKFKLFMIGYLMFRFYIEFLKARETYFLGLGAIQIACALGLLYYAAYLVQPVKLLSKPES